MAQCGTLSFGDIQVEEDGQFSVEVFLDEPELFEMMDVLVIFTPSAGADIAIDANDNCISGGRPAPFGEATALIIPVQTLKQGTQTLVPIYCSDFKNETFLSLSFATSADQLQILNVIPAVLKDIDETAFHINKAGNALNLIWFPYDNQEQSLPANEPLFYLEVSAKTTVENIAKSLFLVNDDNFKNNASGEESRLELLTINPVVAAASKDLLLDVYPNPVSANYQLNFIADTDQLANITIFDSNGKLVYQQSLSAVSGFNTLQISALNTLPAGLYYQHLSTVDQIATTKIIKN